MLKTSETGSRSKKFALTAKLAQCWTGPNKIAFVGSRITSDGIKVGPTLLLLEVRKEPGREINARVFMYRFKKCYTLHEAAEAPKFSQ